MPLRWDQALCYWRVDQLYLLLVGGYRQAAPDEMHWEQIGLENHQLRNSSCLLILTVRDRTLIFCLDRTRMQSGGNHLFLPMFSEPFGRPPSLEHRITHHCVGLAGASNGYRGSFFVRNRT